MIKQRYINTGFWDDYYVSQLDPSEKLLFIYLITNPCTNLLGVYQIPLKRIALDTGFDIEMIKKIMARFAEDEKVYFEVGWVIVKNHLKNQTLSGPRVDASIQKSFEECPDWLKSRLQAKNDTLSIPYIYPIDTPHNNTIQEVNNNKQNKNNIVNSNELTRAVPEEFGDQEVNKIVDHFEKKIGKMPRPVYQRRAAKTLIQRHGFEKTIGAINAVAASRGEQYAPNITSLTQLRDKWLDLENFYARKQNKKGGVAIIS